MGLPEQLEYRQRRLSYRVPIPMSRQLRVIIENTGDTMFEGVLHDLSHGGAGMVFPDAEPVVKPGLLHECAIELVGDEWRSEEHTSELQSLTNLVFRHLR